MRMGGHERIILQGPREFKTHPRRPGYGRYDGHRMN